MFSPGALQLRRKHGMSDKDIMKANLWGFTEKQRWKLQTETIVAWNARTETLGAVCSAIRLG